MKPTALRRQSQSEKPIKIGFTCWLWERKRTREVLSLAQSLGLKVKVTEKINGLRREIEAQVSGTNVDSFVGRFARL